MPDKALLRSYIVKEGMSQKDLAARIGVSKNTLSSEVNRKIPFNTNEIEAICSLLGIYDMAVKASIFLPKTSQK